MATTTHSFMPADNDPHDPPGLVAATGAAPAFSPLYQQIKALILNGLQQGEWKPGEAILRPAQDMLVAEGLGRLTIEAVAERARVGKPTIYRYWKNAQELAMAALMAGQPPVELAGSGGRARERLYQQMDNLVAIFASPRGRQIALTMAAAEPDSELAKAFRTRVMLEQREEGRSILAEAEARGDIRRGTDIEAVLDMLYAPVFYRLLVGHLPLSQAFGRAVVDTLLGAVATRE